MKGRYLMLRDGQFKKEWKDVPKVFSTWRKTVIGFKGCAGWEKKAWGVFEYLIKINYAERLFIKGDDVCEKLPTQ